ncbi:hypothetical protein O0Q50_20810 [Priestia aryabhattai]|uniref:Uncharacterized protein n=1 Tax=Priestia aryabhattai TaxID=412384 RepID=A0AAX6NCT1_PRIAR|nr:hypothetical protein [Priestia aryabhattai]MDU9693619.1 hypothetical protein [Priestia aryabhattai]
MELKDWVHSEIIVLEESPKQGGELITLGLRGTSNKYYYILSGNSKKGFSIKCMSGMGRSQTSIKWFVYYYIEQEMKRHLYAKYPSLELKEVFASQSYIESTFSDEKVNAQLKLKDWFVHFSTVISATLVAIVAITVCFALIAINQTLLPLLFIIVLATSYYMSTKEAFKSRLVQYQIFKHYSQQANCI